MKHIKDVSDKLRMIDKYGPEARDAVLSDMIRCHGDTLDLLIQLHLAYASNLHFDPAEGYVLKNFGSEDEAIQASRLIDNFGFVYDTAVGGPRSNGTYEVRVRFKFPSYMDSLEPE